MPSFDYAGFLYTKSEKSRFGESEWAVRFESWSQLLYVLQSEQLKISFKTYLHKPSGWFSPANTESAAQNMMKLLPVSDWWAVNNAQPCCMCNLNSKACWMWICHYKQHYNSWKREEDACSVSLAHVIVRCMFYSLFPKYFVSSTLLLHRGLVNVSSHKTITGTKIPPAPASFPARTRWRQTTVCYSYQPQGRVTSDLLWFSTRAPPPSARAASRAGRGSASSPVRPPLFM